jgi:hypothetical protein
LEPADASFEQPQFGRSRFTGALPGNTDEMACCCGGNISRVRSDGSIGSGARWGCCPGGDIGSGGVRTDRCGCGRLGRIYGRTLHCSFLGIEGIQRARQGREGEDSRSDSSNSDSWNGDPSNSKPSDRPKWSCAVSQRFASVCSDISSVAACAGPDSPTSPNSGMMLEHRVSRWNANGLKKS